MEKLIEKLIRDGYLKTPRIIEAFKEIKRKDFLLPKYKKMAGLNEPLPIDHGQTISQPLTVAFMLELLQAKSGDKILDVGSGSGWSVALISEIVGPKGRVYGLERIQELAEFAECNINKYNFISSKQARIIQGDGYKGLPEYAPFDKIIVAAAAKEVPKNLLVQLKIGGRLVLPIGETMSTQDMVVIDKGKNGQTKEKRYPGFIFVPLINDN
ncbi:protein-L-isoaspartate(D-aspartate) O-methyltransferase [Candidatus Parcubacteria bacterium]|nr:protein-L-isoaspartate(D-aspartate) O-methyltransferase [Candidatus Parcubacteria bacterium]